jgi:RimJ/RimL family protein N-acetyltransferase
VKHAFDVAEHDTLVACFHDGNESSARILKRIGFAITGSSTNYAKSQNRDVSITNVSLARNCWQRNNQKTRLT